MEKNTKIKSQDNKTNRPSRRRFPRKPAEKSEFDHKVVDVRRVSRVMAGGRRFSFSVVCILGNRRGKVGVGIGKASDTASAIQKAQDDAKKNMIKVNLDDNNSIPFQAEAKYTASRIMLKPSPGKGLVAGGSVRVLLDLAGIKDVNAKIISRSKNKLNNSRATIMALKKLNKEKK